MSIFKCKMCGATLEIGAQQTIATCEYCGTQQTLPRLDDDHRANLYDRAGHFRRNNEFDKAAGIYEKILNEDPADAEAYWSLVLCRYGIEYVEDPATRKRVPTVNRAQFTAVFDDDNYKQALAHADMAQQAVYQAEAQTINEIQKGILAISQQEKPFDVFICYKETDANGRRTPDSVMAYDLYQQLTNEGLNVFFARVTLEDKLGIAYEPYIFAALNSARVMVVLGTRPDYFNAVWVKNEWSRYLAIVKAAGGKKHLVPAYKDMDPYDLPEEFAHLQAQDMAKLGAMQDLVRGVKKLVGVTAGAAPVAAAGENATAAPLRRMYMLLADGKFKAAAECAERILDTDSTCAEGYLGKLLAETGCSTADQLAEQPHPFINSENYRQAIQYAAPELQAQLQKQKEKWEHAQKAAADKARKTIRRIVAIAACLTVVCGAAFGVYSLVTRVVIPNNNYKAAQQLLGDGQYELAIDAFSALDGYKDSAEKIEQATMDIVEQDYNAAMELFAAGEYEQAIQAFGKLDNYKESAQQIEVAEVKIQEAAELKMESDYLAACELLKNKKYEEAKIAFCELNDYKDCQVKLDQIANLDHNLAEVGNILVIGKLEQDNDLTNGTEPLEWVVVDKVEGELLLLSRYVLDESPYYSGRDMCTWEKSDIYKWLSENLGSNSFSDKERQIITKEPFLLNKLQVSSNVRSDEIRKGVPTPYAVRNKNYVALDNVTIEWWVNSSAGGTRNKVYVNYEGEVWPAGIHINETCGIRPAMWIKIDE